MTALRAKPTRASKTTVLIVGEGPTEKAFLQFIKELYIMRDADIVVKVECGSGGAPCSVVQRAIRLRGSRAYDKCFVLFDADLPLETDGKLKHRMQKKPSVGILNATPCIEGLFLAILRYPQFSQKSATSDNCKREFEANYLSADKKMDKRAYTAHFSKEVLERFRKDIPELDAILKAMQV